MNIIMQAKILPSIYKYRILTKKYCWIQYISKYYLYKLSSMLSTEATSENDTIVSQVPSPDTRAHEW